MMDLLAMVLRSGTPLIYATLAGMIAARAGVWQLGLEGLLIIGACATVVGVDQTHSIALALGLAVVLCAAASALLWVVIEKLRANPIIAGLGLTGLGLGATDMAIQAIYGSEGAVTVQAHLPRLGDEADSFAGLSVLVIAMPFITLALWALLRRTRFGLKLSAAGEHPFAARSVGISPPRMRLIALLIGGVLCALGGAELGLGSVQIFSIGMTAGRGYMAFAAVIFGGNHPLGSVGAALFFSLVQALSIKAQLAWGAKVPQELLLALPYLATVAGVWASGRMRGVVVAGEVKE